MSMLSIKFAFNLFRVFVAKRTKRVNLQPKSTPLTINYHREEVLSLEDNYSLRCKPAVTFISDAHFFSRKIRHSSLRTFSREEIFQIILDHPGFYFASDEFRSLTNCAVETNRFDRILDWLTPAEC